MKIHHTRVKRVHNYPLSLYESFYKKINKPINYYLSTLTLNYYLSVLIEVD